VNLTQVLEDEILPLVEKPSRYLGNEVNITRKPADEVDVRMLLCFPDLYDLGLGNLGVHILYTCVNALPWASCERVYAPGVDMEAELRKRDLPLFALESKDALSEFDGIGFTLQSELTYTNILNILDLTGMPLRTADRGEDDPLTFAGGPAVFNPEPIAPFIDFFVIGDGEDAIVEIAHVLRATKGKPRRERLEALAALEGIYVPELYPFETVDSGAILPVEDAPKIRKRLTRDLDGATFPTDYIVPFTKQVHDRISLEVLRGCTQGCRFCQAGMVTRPVRERRLERVDQLLKETLASTGYEEVSLVSLSTCDYSRVRQLVENTVETLRADNVAVSLPSLRLDSFSVDLADMVAGVRRTGLTVAPEAASPRLRAVINKWIRDEDLLNMADRAFQLQWSHIKLYFMIGLPTERDDDIVAIADLAQRTVDVGRKYNRKARVNLGVSTFVPKPFTPFQWAEQLPYDEVVRRQDVLQEHLRDNAIKFGRHHPEETWLEGVVSRSDRRVADVIELAFRKGARFEAWSEHLDVGKWREAIAETGFDVADTMRARDVDERLPWDHIDVLIPKTWFQDDWKRALELKHAQDCRHKRCHKCGVIDQERELCASMLRDNIEGRKHEAAWTRKQLEPLPTPDPVQRLRFRIGRTGNARFLSHLESMTAWLRALRRAEARLAYSQGFHPHPKFAFSAASPVGEESLGDYMDVTLVERVDADAFLDRLASTVPEGFQVLDVAEVGLRATALMAVNEGGIYRVAMPHEDAERLGARIDELNAAEEIRIQRKRKQRKGRRRRIKIMAEVDIRPMVRHMALKMEGEIPVVELELVTVDGKHGKVREMLALLCEHPEYARVVRVDTLMRKGDDFVSIGTVSAEMAEALKAEAAVPVAPVAEPAPTLGAEA
jgi:radical SAM family uncharacterized protein/radical SAM-linked protein